MWNTIQSLTQHPVMLFLKKLCGDPVQLYVIMLMTTIMEYYHSGWTWVYTILSVFLTFGLMRFYDFVAKHKFLGPLCYLAFLFLGLTGVNVFIGIGARNYPLYFLVWFLTPQGIVDFSIWYTIAIYLLMTGFLSSAVYYFGKVRYRMVMQFLIMLIPLSMYAKEGIQMPALLVIILLASYFLLMIYCRQLRESPDVRRLSSFHGNLSVAVFVASFSILAAVVPKPEIKADREFIENAMGTSSLSDILMEAISMFTDSTDNSVMFSNNSRTLYYVHANEPLRLRTQTYTFYRADDSWNKTEYYDYPRMSYSTDKLYQPRELLQCILDAAAADPEYAEKYGLTEFAGTVLPEQPERRLLLLPNLAGTDVLPFPTRTMSIPEWQQDISFMTYHENVTLSGAGYGYRVPIELTYYSDVYANYEIVSRILSAIKAEDYTDILTEAGLVMSRISDEKSDFLFTMYSENYNAHSYLDECRELDFQSDAIDALAAELTEGLESDYDKARAIERYFREEGFIYDLSYQKGKDDNAETFLFETKRGVCYEFATAMILLCRSAGIPARYAQGYNMSERYEDEIIGYPINFTIKARDSHGYPEVYIAGYGWLSFEPTVAMTEEEQGGVAENFYVMLWGFVLFALALLAAAGYVLAPRVREWYFRRRIVHMQPAEAAAAVFRRMRRTLYLPESTTVMELAEASQVFAKPEEFFAQLDALMYAPQTAAAMTAAALSRDYIAWQDARAAHEKEERKNRKHTATRKKGE